MNFERGIDPKKAIHIGIEVAIEDFLKEVNQTTSNLDHKFKICARFGKTSYALYLLEKGADIHSEWDLALRTACNKGFTDTVQALLEAGANPEVIHLNTSMNTTRLRKEIKTLIRQYQDELPKGDRS